MKNSHLRYPCLIAAFYLSANLGAQQAKNDTMGKEKKIEEVVLIGYGSQKKENVTGSIGLVTAKDLADKPNPNPISSVQGKVSGVQILNSGTPGGSPRVDIRGISSITGKTVFIVDGMITDDISFLSPQDIESMSVLKDPSSLAIFGAQASNGAVIIKTKMGRGKPIYNFSTYVGVKHLTNIPKMVNSDQYIELFNEKLKNEGAKDTSGYLSRSNFPADTNWFDEIFSTAFIHSSDFSASGSKGKLSYFGSVGYLSDEGNLRAGRGINSGNDFNKFNARLNLSYKVTDFLTVGNNFTYSNILINKSQNPVLTAYSAPPIYYPINPATGNFDYISVVSLSNPRAMMDLYRGKNKQNRFLENIWAEVKFLKDFTFRTSYALDYADNNNYDYTDVVDYNPKAQPTPASLERWHLRDRNYIWDNTLTWKKKFNAHNIELLAGYSQTENWGNYGNYEIAKDVKYDGTENSLDIHSGSTYIDRENVYLAGKLEPSKDRIQSIFGRLNYDFAGRYLLNASLRRDGATGFSSDDRYKLFPAVSVGWVISREEFMKGQDVFSLLKLRGSWGRLGNPKVQRGYTLNTTIFSSGAYFGGVGYPAQTITEIVDPTIGWETTEGKDIGLEMAFLKNKLKVEATYFDKDSKNIVYAINQPSVSGASNNRSFLTNAYSFNNKGFEGSINYDGRLTEKVRLGAYANITTVNNKITSVYADSYNEPGAHLFGSTIIRLQTGQPVGSYYGYKVVGVFQNADQVAAAAKQNGAVAGALQYADLDGNGVIDANDMTFLGSPVPKFTYGFGFNLAVSDFDFAMDFNGVHGNKIYNYNREQRYGNESWDLDMYNNRWHGAGTSNTYPMITNDQAIIAPSSFYVEDGSFFRIRNIQLGYNFPKSVTQGMEVQKMRLYISAQNPWTSFKYHGFSPEILNTDRVQMGIDNNIFPISAIYTFGMNLTF